MGYAEYITERKLPFYDLIVFVSLIDKTQDDIRMGKEKKKKNVIITFGNSRIRR